MNLKTGAVAHHRVIKHASLHRVLLLLLLQVWWGNCHPQCLDFKPPFGPRQPLSFCKEYSKFGCCDLDKDLEISVKFNNIMSNFDHSGYNTCGKYIRNILCQVSGVLNYKDVWGSFTFAGQPDVECVVLIII